MNGFSPKATYSIAKKEFLDNFRNKWTIILTIVFVLIMLLFSYVFGIEEEGIFGNMESTVLGLLASSSLIIPIIGIILGYSTISGEAESGSLYVLLSYPLRRIEILIGKVLGLGSVIAFSTLIGFGIGGIIITISSGDNASWLSYFSFIGLTIMLGLIYLNLSILVSSICKSRARSIGGGILIFFWSIIYGIIVSALYYATTPNATERLREIRLTGEAPQLFYNSAVFNPGDLYSYTVTKVFNSDAYIGDFLNLGNMLVFLIIWLIVPVILAYIFFRRRDI